MFNSLSDFTILHDFLPILKKYRNCIFVIKYGGAAMQNKQLQIDVIKEIVFLYTIGIKIILVHGGGPSINDLLYKLNMKPKFHNGMRITDAETMQIVQMVLAGQVNKDLVSLVNQLGVNSIGLCGKDANLIMASQLFNNTDNLVGKIERINHKLLDILLKNNYLPVIASIATDMYGQTYNINADIVASYIAQVFKADKLLLLTDTPGILSDCTDSNTIIKELSLNDILKLKQNNIVTGGMIPKVDACYNAVNNNVFAAHIIDGRIHNSLFLELFTKDRIGSMITK